MGRLATVYLLRDATMQPFLGYTSAQISAVAYAHGAVNVLATETEVQAWMDLSEYVWIRSGGSVGIRKLRGEEISSRARQCCQNYVEELGFRLGT